MSTFVTGFDSVQDNIPATAEAAFGYTSGFWPTWLAAWFKALPAKFKRSIAVNAAHDADFLDMENGDATIDQFPAWFHRQKARGVKKPGGYTSLANVAALVRICADAGIKRGDFILWTAHYTRVAHVCSPGCGFGMPTVADGTQYTDVANGENLDADYCNVEAMFMVAAPSDPYSLFYDQKFNCPDARPGRGGHTWLLNERQTVKALDEALTHPTSNMGETLRLVYAVLSLRKHVWNQAHAHRDKNGKPSWNLDRRGQRWHALNDRTKGL